MFPELPDEEGVLLATTAELPGYEIDEVIGLVAGFASDRERALRLMEDKARDVGANAVVGVRIDSCASGGAFVSTTRRSRTGRRHCRRSPAR